jgi:hypothetical protein
MATTINSGYANSPKLTANIADHADVYGGRALVFDGVSDYLDCGTELGNKFGNNYTGGISVSMWINVDSNTSITEKGLFFIGNFAGSYGEFTITQNTNNLMIYLNQNAYQKTFAYTARDTWTHICFVVDQQSEANTKFYIDGEAQSVLTSVGDTFPSSTDLDFIGRDFIIGNFFNGNYPFHGKITDTKLFNTALTEAQVQELYKKPENTPSAVQDSLVAWYPMIEGNPESPQSIVYDHSEKKLDSDFARAVTADNWNAYTNMTVNTITGGISIVSPTTASGTPVSVNGAYIYFRGGTFLGENQLTTKDLVIGKEYCVTFNAYYSGGASGVYADINNGNSFSVFSDTFTTTNKSYKMYFKAGNTTAALMRFQQIKLDNTVYITDIKVQEVQMGNHATTNFFGDMSDVLSSTQKTNMDAILESDDNNFDFSDTAGNQVTQSTLGSDIITNGDYSSGTTGWSIGAGGTADTSSGALVYTYSGSGNNFVKQEGITAVNGALYKAVFTVTESGGSAYYGYWDGTNLSSSVINLDTGQKTYTQYFTATSTSITIRFVAGSSNGNSITVDNVSVKEITTTKFFPLFGSDEISGNNLKLTNDGTTQAHVALPFTTVVGKSYASEIKLTTANMSGGLSVSDDLNENTLSVSSSSGAIITSNTFVATGTTSYVHIKNNSTNNNQYNLYDNLKVREVGVSSSGFETAINEPVVPQVPLMRYNEKLFLNGNNGSSTEVLWSNIGSAFASSKFTLSVVHLGRDTDEITTIFDITESGYTDYIRLFRNNSGRYYVYIENANDSKNIYEYASYVDDANFHHIVFTCDGSKWCFYINGYKEREESYTHTTAHLNLSTTDMRVGMISTGSESYRAIGIIDELSLWNTALTYDEVKELYADSVVKDATTHSKKGNLLGYWRNDGVTTWQDRRGWSYLDFDGSSDEVTLDSELTFSGVFSVSFWVKHNSSGAEYVLGKVGGDQDYFYAHPTYPRWRINDNIISSNSDMAVGVWHHVLGVRDSSDNFIWYLNGSLATLYNGSSYVTTGVTRSGDFDVQYFGRSLNTYGEIELTNVAFFNTDKSSSASTFYNNGLSYDYTTESGITNYYKMDSSSTLLDRVGSVNGTVDATLNDGNDGSVQGSPDSITIREGLNSNRDGLGFYFTNPSSNVLRLNGSSDYVSVPHTKSLVVGEQLTLECWAKLDRVTPSEDNTMISKYDEAGDSGREYSLQFPTDKRLIFRVSSAGSSATLKTLRADNAISDGNLWHHYAVTFASGTMKMYVDGSEVSASTSGATVTSIKQDGTANVVVGCVSTSSTPRHFFNGLIDEARVYNRALSGSEINKNYKHQKGKHKND